MLKKRPGVTEGTIRVLAAPRPQLFSGFMLSKFSSLRAASSINALFFLDYMARDTLSTQPLSLSTCFHLAVHVDSVSWAAKDGGVVV